MEDHQDFCQDIIDKCEEIENLFFAGVGQVLSLDKAAGPAGVFNKEFDWHSSMNSLQDRGKEEKIGIALLGGRIPLMGCNGYSYTFNESMILYWRIYLQ